MVKNATIIALAWPDTKVIHEGKWYDIPMKWLGILKDGYYSAGHAAFLLVNHYTNDIHYFDFGRYHTPLKHGRVRSKLTDPDIEVKIKAQIKDRKILNFNEILLERYGNKACHGDGKLIASIVRGINFENAYNKVIEMQNREAICYGPLEWKGTNCSRFVVRIVLVSSTNWLTRLLIRLPYTVSATPRSNTKVLNDLPFYFEVIKGHVHKRKSKFYFFKKWFVNKDDVIIEQLKNSDFKNPLKV